MKVFTSVKDFEERTDEWADNRRKGDRYDRKRTKDLKTLSITK